MGLAGAAAEDAEAECIRRITETQIVTGWHILAFFCCAGRVQKSACLPLAIWHGGPTIACP